MLPPKIQCALDGVVDKLEVLYEETNASKQSFLLWANSVREKIKQAPSADRIVISEVLLNNCRTVKKTTRKLKAKESIVADNEENPFDATVTISSSKSDASCIDKENNVASINTRSSRAASKVAAARVNSQLNLTLKNKLRRPTEELKMTRASSFNSIESPKPIMSSTVIISKADTTYDCSPSSNVKKQIEVFEKMSGNVSPPSNDADDDRPVPKTPVTPFPPVRMTRTKTKAIGKNDKIDGASAKSFKKPTVVSTKVKRSSLLSILHSSKAKRNSNSSDKEVKTEPKAEPTGKVIPIIKIEPVENSLKKKKEELLKKQEKEEEVRRKKEEALKILTEEARRKREEKRARAAAAREAAEKQKLEANLKAEKEKEERKRMILEREEKLKEEQLRKRNLTAQKAAETEERRKQEEAARQARLRQVAEEQKRAAIAKLKEQEGQAVKRKLEEAKQAKHAKKIAKKDVEEYKCTPSKDERPLMKPKSEDDYGLDDASASDSSDDESNPKKIVPLWARSENRKKDLYVQSFYPSELIYKFMEIAKPVTLENMFKSTEFKLRSRTSSAVWNTPPRLSHLRK